MNDAYIFIGSNVERETNYLHAITRLSELGDLIAASPVYDTPALGGDPHAPRFYNGAARLETELPPHALRRALRKIELEMGRVRTADKFAPRTIDLDLVLYDDVKMDDGELTLPDPYLFERGFMARILARVNPYYVIPPDGPTLAELAQRWRGERDEMQEAPALSWQVQQWISKKVKGQTSMSDLQFRLPRPQDDAEWNELLAEIETTRILPEMRVAPEQSEKHTAIADAVRTILSNVGEDPLRQGLLKTPERVARALDELLAGYTIDPRALVNGALFEVAYHDMVVVKDIEFYSLCEHHLLPFFGRVHVAYIPDGQVIGLSKIPRIVNMYARRLQLQERMTHEIADFVQDILRPRGVAVVVTGQHMCVEMRGVKQSASKMVTQVMYGEFQERQVRELLNERLSQED